MSYLSGPVSKTSTPCLSTTLPKMATTRACVSTLGLEHRHETAKTAKTGLLLLIPLPFHPHRRPRSPVTIRAPMTSALAQEATRPRPIPKTSPLREVRRRRGGGTETRIAAAERVQSAASQRAKAWASGELRSTRQSSRVSRQPWLRGAPTLRRRSSQRCNG